ncbi:hypothetical protein EUTSA_v10029164mg [Eutrema salsugineum]|uniref:FBD domain-containing protein n=1 Tax=Eutrema salsugineum TaxID=72664 RepID=V4LEY9_EUTSA|nr:hypothetical protein EUTSA_v10029164mg [Eutrema salsugineum]
MLLSKRWRFIWSMVPKLVYSENYEVEKSVWDFLDKSLQLNKALTLESLRIELGPYCPKHADVGKCVSNAVNRCVRELNLQLNTFSRPHILPACLYTSKTLVKLTLTNKILVDVPSSVCLPSLESMNLTFVVYKDEDSLVRLLSSCLVLKDLFVVRDKHDNVARFTVKVSSLERSLVMDSPGLRYVKIVGSLRESFSIHNMPRLEVAFVNVETNYKFMRSFSSVMFLDLVSTQETSGNLSVSWKQPSSVPICLFNLEIFEWKAYGGRREEKEFLAYILANSIFLKTVGISRSSFYNYKPGENSLDKEQSMMEELESLYRVSASSQLLFSTQLRWRMSRKTGNHVDEI